MSYDPTVWQTGDTVTAEKLNKLENGVKKCSQTRNITGVVYVCEGYTGTASLFTINPQFCFNPVTKDYGSAQVDISTPTQNMFIASEGEYPFVSEVPAYMIPSDKYDGCFYAPCLEILLSDSSYTVEIDGDVFELDDTHYVLLGDFFINVNAVL